MKVAVAGAGNVGQYVASDLVERGHDVILIEKNGNVIAQDSSKINCTWYQADACEPLSLQGTGLDECDVMVATTGDDKVNLVASLLAKQEFGIPRVIARVNDPNNQWLFNDSWGVDVAVSPPHLLTSLVEEAVTVGDLVRLMPLEKGRISLVDFRLDEHSAAAGKVISELSLPQDCALVAVVRDGHVIAPREETPLMVGDEVLALATPESEQELEEMLSGV
ncbi:MAG: potassium channel family protein, partial [Actinomycetota bacterium]